MGRADFAIGIVAVAPTPASSGTTLTLQPGQGADMPPTPFYATVGPQGYVATKGNAEKIKVSAVTGDVLTIQRAQSPSSAKAIAVDWVLYNGIYTNDFDDTADDAVAMAVAL